MVTKVFKLENTGLCHSVSRLGNLRPVDFLMNSYPSVYVHPTFFSVSSRFSLSSFPYKEAFLLFNPFPFSLLIVQLLQEKSPPPLFTWTKLPKWWLIKHKPLKIAPKSSSETCYLFPVFLAMHLPLNTNFPDKRSFCFYVVLFLL